MEFEIVYEIPPLRAIYRTVIKADDEKDLTEKIRSSMSKYKIKEINLISR